MKSQAFSKILILVILIVLAGGGVLAWQYFGVPEKITEEPEEVTKDETANWQTYRNEEYGFELKYPVNLAIRDEINPANILFLEMIPKGREAACFSISVKPNPTNIGLIEDLRRYAGTKYEDPYSIAVADCLENRGIPIEIGDKEAYKCDTVREPFISNIILFSTNNYIYHIKNICEEDLDMGDIYNQILSTFRFLE